MSPAPTWRPSRTHAARHRGLTSFAVRPPGPRDRYAPVTYLEPNTERNLRAHGFRHAVRAFRGEVMTRRDSGRAAITARLKLASEAEASQAYGFLMYLPVYRTDAPIATIDERRQAFLGFVNSPFRMVDLMRASPATAMIESTWRDSMATVSVPTR